MTIHKINKYEQIPIIPNSLIVLDIDETLIKFEHVDKKWWKTEFDAIYSTNRNYILTEQMVLNKWLNIVSNSKPSLVDNCIHQFIQNAEQTNCKIVLLTARNNSLFELTLRHLAEVGLNFSHIYFNENKGQELTKIITNEFVSYKNIIVVDDLVANLLDIEEKIMNLDINLHLYNMQI